jgi:hypothetical protein
MKRKIERILSVMMGRSIHGSGSTITLMFPPVLKMPSKNEGEPFRNTGQSASLPSFRNL